MKLFKSLPLVYLILFWGCHLSYAWTGKVIGVSDGDTIKVLHAGKPLKVSLYGVVTPEIEQAYGQKAKKVTAKLVNGKTVDVSVIDSDQYGHIVGLVTIGSKNLNRTLVETGYAWVYDKQCKQSYCGDWKGLELKAKAAKRGLWQDQAPTPPWKWRKGNYTIKAETPPSKNNNPNLLGVGTKKQFYHGNTKNKIFHRPGGKNYNCKDCTAKFLRRKDAIKSGYKPCEICEP